MSSTLMKLVLENGWRIVSTAGNVPTNTISKHLEKQFKFKSFNDAFSFMTSVAMIAEQYDHHPDWSNYYNLVLVKWNSHCAGNDVTDVDWELAQKTDTVYTRYTFK